MAKPSLGMQDAPIASVADDSLGLDPYAIALARFIGRCPTPISIGIQGDWGLGKTSLMQLVAAHLTEDAKRANSTVGMYWINTWQLSQFDLGDRLPITLLQSLVSKVSSESPLRASLFQKLKTLAGKSARVVAHVASQKLEDVSGLDVESALGSTGSDHPGALLESLKDDFQALCEQACAGKGPDARLVFFIDDLDRLLPARAVEMMEVMKNFLDVPRTVFVLACDYQVVVKGLEAKFKVGIKDLGGRSFFDKIIQVPFRMPRQAYRMEQHIAQVLERSSFPIHGGIGDYVELLRFSLGFNPRAIKRHCNTLQLLRLVLEQQQDQEGIATDPYKLKLLFAALCLEAEHPELYTWLSASPTNSELKLRLGQLSDDARLQEVVGDAGSALGDVPIPVEI